MNRFCVPVAIVVLIMRNIDVGDREVLLQRRQNTGFGDGMWDFACAGHVEEGESMTEACVRESFEELGIRTQPEDFKFFTLIYKKDSTITYVNSYFCLTKYYGNIEIMEPSKCSELKWFNVMQLPEDLLPDRKRAFEALLNGDTFIEYGWHE